jgi:hypothetical protein
MSSDPDRSTRLATARRRRWSLGIVAPLALALIGVIDVATRMAPMPFLSPEEQLWSNRPADTAFVPNRRYQTPHPVGDLARIGNLPTTEDRPPLQVTIDRLGYRNKPEIAAARPIAGILFGSSFSVADGQNDDETLAAQLTARTGRVIYNAGGKPFSPARLEALASRLDMRGGMVLQEILERIDPADVATDRVTEADGDKSRCARLDRWPRLGSLCRWVKRKHSLWPLRTLISGVRKGLENDELLPNEYATAVLPARLRDGRRILFYPKDVTPHREGAVERAVAYWAPRARDLRSEGRALMLVLVPNKYTVYAPLLEGGPLPFAGQPNYLATLQRALEAEGIAVVNLTEPFKQRAATDLERGQLLYWLDDTHWNARGISFAAELIAARWSGGSPP